MNSRSTSRGSACSFPEKRDFFLENQGTFSFGGVPINSAGGNFNGGFIGSGGSDAPIMFYSRRIGLNEGHEVPLNAGGRLTRTGRQVQRRPSQYSDRRRAADGSA